MDYVSRTWRLELFFKSIEELKVKQLAIAKQHGIKRFNITNKVETSSCTALEIDIINLF